MCMVYGVWCIVYGWSIGVCRQVESGKVFIFKKYVAQGLHTFLLPNVTEMNTFESWLTHDIQE